MDDEDDFRDEFNMYELEHKLSRKLNTNKRLKEFLVRMSNDIQFKRSVEPKLMTIERQIKDMRKKKKMYKVQA
jgi:hypothetical protein